MGLYAKPDAVDRFKVKTAEPDANASGTVANGGHEMPTGQTVTAGAVVTDPSIATPELTAEVLGGGAGRTAVDETVLNKVAERYAGRQDVPVLQNQTGYVPSADYAGTGIVPDANASGTVANGGHEMPTGQTVTTGTVANGGQGMLSGQTMTSPWKEGMSWAQYAKDNDISIADAYNGYNEWARQNGKEPADVMEFLRFAQKYDVDQSVKENEKAIKKQQNQEKWERLGNLFSHIGNFIGTVHGAPDQKPENAQALKERQRVAAEFAQGKRDKAAQSYLNMYFKDREAKLAQAKADREAAAAERKAELDNLTLQLKQAEEERKKAEEERKQAKREEERKAAEKKLEESQAKIDALQQKTDELKKTAPLREQKLRSEINRNNRANTGGSGGRSSGGRRGSGTEGYVVYDNNGKRREYKGKNGLHDAYNALPASEKVEIEKTATSSEKAEKMKDALGKHRARHEKKGGGTSTGKTGGGRYGGTKAGSTGNEKHKFNPKEKK